jgi:hypothetical protein
MQSNEWLAFFSINRLPTLFYFFECVLPWRGCHGESYIACLRGFLRVAIARWHRCRRANSDSWLAIVHHHFVFSEGNYGPPIKSHGGSEVKFWDPGDDRINREPGQPAALYCRNKGDLHVYAINVDNSKGILGLVVTKVEIDAVISGNPTTNALVKQSADGKFRLFYLPATNELSFITPEVHSGKQYSHVWKGLCP